MPVRYDPILTSRLAEEIAARLAGRPAAALVLDPGHRQAALRFEGGPLLRLLLDPSQGAVLLEPGGRATGRAASLAGRTLAGCAAPPDERVLRLVFAPRGHGDDGPAARAVVVELRSDARNVLLLDAEERIEAALAPRLAGGRPAAPGRTYAPPVSGRRWVGEPPEEEEWIAFFAARAPADRRSAALREVAWISGLNVDAVLGAAVEEDAGDQPLREAHGRYLELRSAPPGAWLLERAAGPQPYPLPLGDPGARRAPSLLEAMRIAAEAAAAGARGTTAGGPPGPGAGGSPASDAAELRRALATRLERTRRRRGALERQLARADAEELRALGHLLLARAGEVERGASRARLAGFDGRPVEVELDPSLGPVENAERLYAEARRRERAARRLPGEVRRAKEEAERLAAGLERLEREGPVEELWELAGGRAVGGAGTGAHAPEALPYRRLRSSGGLEIRVGRGARANDELTFHHSAPDDVWLHARQVPGAHVILRWGRRDENPPRRDLVEAAVAAALNSEARHSGTVAVDWTRRKHVRKPRGSPPGSVIPDRVKTLFVQPDAALLDRLRIDG